MGNFLSSTMQDSSKVSKAPRLAKSDALIDWTRSASEIDCLILIGRRVKQYTYPHLSDRYKTDASTRVFERPDEALNKSILCRLARIRHADDGFVFL